MGNWEVSIHLLITFFCIALTAGDWSYKDADKWGDDYPSCKETNKYQSPIRLLNFFLDKWDHTVTQKGIKNQIEGMVVNNGKFLEMLIDLKPKNPTPSVMLRIGDELSEYFINGIQFHWPAEHMINGNSSDLEVQMHYKLFGTDEILIVSNVYQVCAESEWTGMEKMEDILNGFSKAPETADMKFSLVEFSNFDSGFYVYNGSLTTPPCTVGVTWIVYDEALCISEDELAAFKNLKDSDGENIPPNNRPAVSEGGQKIYYTPW